MRLLVSAAILLAPGHGSRTRAERGTYGARTGEVIWDFDTARPYKTINAVEATGGAIDGPGVVVVDGMLFVNFSYTRYGGMPGNVLLAFAP